VEFLQRNESRPVAQVGLAGLLVVQAQCQAEGLMVVEVLNHRIPVVSEEPVTLVADNVPVEPVSPRQSGMLKKTWVTMVRGKVTESAEVSVRVRVVECQCPGRLLDRVRHTVVVGRVVGQVPPVLLPGLVAISKTTLPCPLKPVVST